MKIYLLNAPYVPRFGRSMRWQDTGRAGTLYYPVWLAYATALVGEHYEARLVDAPAWEWTREQTLADVRRFEPELVVIDSSFPSLRNDLSMAEAIKAELPDATIMMVGPPAPHVPGDILASPGVDLIARWEYDFTVLEVAQALERGVSLENVRGISYQGDDGRVYNTPDREIPRTAELDAIPFVAKVVKKHLRPRDYFLTYCLYPELQIITARGCPFQCTFCSWPQTLTGHVYRGRTIANVLDEFEWVRDNLTEVREIFIEDDTFTIDRKRVLAFADEYRRRGLDLPWSANVRAEADLDQLQAMSMAGCRTIIVGFESGDDHILKNIKKGGAITVDRMRKFAADAKRAGLQIHGDFIIGLPGETRETIDSTRRFLNEIRPHTLQVSVAHPFPGTEFYDWAVENGYLAGGDLKEYLTSDGHQAGVFSLPGLPAEQMVDVVDDMLRSYYLTPRYVPLALQSVMNRHFPHELGRLLRSARMFVKYASRTDNNARRGHPDGRP